MVNAQQYIEQNYHKNFTEIIAREKDLGGHLDLSSYHNLKLINFSKNPKLTNLKLGYSPFLIVLSVVCTGIIDFSFLLNTPKVNEVHLPRQIGVGLHNSNEVARVIQSLAQASQIQLNQSKAKDMEIKTLKTTNQQQNTQLQELSSILFPNNSYNFTNIKAEVKKFKIQELTPQVRVKRTEFERLINNAINKVESNFTGIIDLLCQNKKQIDDEKNKDPLIQAHLKGQLIAYQNILQTKLTQEELKRILDKQTELSQLEMHLENLQK
ncbi:hypothetical protein C1645_422525 [Glomus cerebriforme]|uniref:Uncharacterized protein n=1 Tax=Glomus cerebriforme TaxID=658196 RepID=A0A397SFG0_9GLOM|nr:hypothetical protein C1645_422525 [Glomus cerebriforme]